jgi:hypothetical protein
MEADVVRARLEAALNELLAKDTHLFSTDAAERSIAARLAMYLQAHFPDHHVDADYNRLGDIPKKVQLPPACEGRRDSDGKSLALPDVIVHRRGAPGPNILVVEIKKTTNPDKGDCDRLRLRAFRDQLGYSFGALIVCETREGRDPGFIVADWVK